MDELKKLLGDELFAQLTAKLGDKKVMLDDGNFVPKARFDEVNNQKKELKTQVDTLTETSKKFEAMQADVVKWKSEAEQVPALKKKMEEWETSSKTITDELTKSKAQLEEYQKKETDWQSKLKTTKIDSAIEKALITNNAKYPELIKAKVDMSKIELDDQGTIKGLDDQLKTMRETYKDLFGEVRISGTGSGSGSGGGEVDPSKMTDAEYFAWSRAQKK
jgi:SMC interacting uncharacterized protein involved in chromosome segregation